MKVYRVCNKEEFDIIMDERSLINIGGLYEVISALNTHSYKSDVRYMHFFKRLVDIGLWDTEQDHYICTYDMPETFLDDYQGLGTYYFYNESIDVFEYAIPSSLVSFDYLKKIQHIDEFITWDDLVNSNRYRRKLTTVYPVRGLSLFRRKGSN